jgi:NAD(P)H-dependent FMN reductase
MRVLGVCGSLQRESGNLTLLRTAAALAPPAVEIVLFDGLRLLPHFDPDLENAGLPAPVEAWRMALSESQAVLIASPEYGHSLPGALKNAIDWVIGSGEFYRKAVAITAAVPSSERGQRGLDALKRTLQAVGAAIVGGAPIVRGAGFEAAVQELLRALLERAQQEQAQQEQAQQ